MIMILPDILQREPQGLFGHGSILAATGHQEQALYLKRLFVRDRILCQEMPDPPGDLLLEAPKVDPKLSTQRKDSNNTSDETCKSCHRLIDPIGFGLENFDELGRFRSHENVGNRL